MSSVNLRLPTRVLLALLIAGLTAAAATYVRSVYELDPYATGRKIPGTTWNLVPLLCIGAASVLIVLRYRNRRAAAAASSAGAITAIAIAAAHWYWQSKWPLTLGEASQADSLLVLVPTAAIALACIAATIVIQATKGRG